MEKALKEHIISFRIPTAQADVVKRMLQEQPISGVKSPSQWFRKVGRDFVAGRLNYKKPEDGMADLDSN